MKVNYNLIRKKLTPLKYELYTNQILNNDYIPESATPYYEQALIILDEIDNLTPDNCLIAGGAYSGKSEIVAIDVCRHLMFKDYRALLLRNTFPQITSSGEVVDKLIGWLCDKERLGKYACKHNQKYHYFEAHSGARIYYGGCDSEKQMDKYRGTSYHRIYMLEASEINGKVLDFMNRSVRSPEGAEGSPIQEMLIHVSNPSYGPGSEYLKKGYVTRDSKHKYYNLDLMMNTKVDRKKYDKRLASMSPRQQAFMRYGNWDYVDTHGLLMSQEVFESSCQRLPPDIYDHTTYNIISIDPAGDGQDFTSMTHMMLLDDYRTVIDDNILLSDSVIEDSMYAFAENVVKNKGGLDKVIVEGEGGSMGVYGTRHFTSVLKDVTEYYATDVEQVPVQGKGKKFKRAQPVAYGIREGSVIINDAIPNKLQLNNQIMYITPNQKEMDQLPSPDFLDSVSQGYNYMIEQLDVQNYYYRSLQAKTGES